MMPRHTFPPPSSGARFESRRLLLAGLVAGAASVVATVAIRAITFTVEDVPAAFTPLRLSSVISLTILGVVAATGACLALNALVARPVATFTRLVPFALALSFIPDVAIWLRSSYQGTARASTVVPLLIMHIAVAALTLVSLVASAREPGARSTSEP
jgi:hypothetical protein